MSRGDTGGPLGGVRVAIFESRLAGPMAELIARQGAEPVEAPSLREVPEGDDREALAFAERLIAGEIDVVIFLTGVGVRHLARAIETRFRREDWVAALNRAKVVIRGPKPLAPLRELKARVDVQAPEPNTWREVLAALDEQLPLAGLRVAVQEYGAPNPELVEGLRRRGAAAVLTVGVYHWALPEDLGPLRAAIGEIAAGRIDAAAFTSAQQARHLIQVAAAEGREAEVRAALRDRVVVASVGPATSEALRELGLPVDVEPEQPKMGPLVAALAERWAVVRKAPEAGGA